MTKNEFEALGISEKDLVCIYIFARGKAIGKILPCFFAEHGWGMDHLYLTSDDDCWMKREINMDDIKSIKILKKEFWSNDHE